MALKLELPRARIKTNPDLPRNVMREVRKFFHANGHNPSEEAYAALSAIPQTVVDILDGTARQAMHICPLDVGLGKTTTLRYTVRAVREEKPDTGMLLCLGRLEQIESMVGALDLGHREYAVLVGRGARTQQGQLFSELGLGTVRASEAPVLITSHAQLEVRLQGGANWADANAFWYRDEPRSIRIWDEAIEMRRHFSIGEKDIAKVLGTDIPRSLRDYAFKVLKLLRNTKHRDLINLPAIDEAQDILSIFENLKYQDYEHVSHQIQNLVALSRLNQALIFHEGKDALLLQYEPSLPGDLLPMIVLDASAKERETYNQQIEDVVLLPDAEKRYDNVTFKIKSGPSGKRAFWANCQERLEEAAEIIRLHPDKKVLIIHPKEVQKWQIGKIGNTLEGLLREELVRNIYYLHWGVHDAVNDYADCSVVIVLSLFIYPRSAYEIIGRAAANRRIRREYGDDEANAIEHGEVLANIRQALGRSCIRRMEGSQAHECTIYMRVPAKSQLRKEFGKLFPGCNVVNLEGKLDAEERVLAFMHAQRRQKEVTWPTVYQATGMAQSHFSALMKRPGLLAALQADGWGFVRSRPNKFIR